MEKNIKVKFDKWDIKQVLERSSVSLNNEIATFQQRMSKKELLDRLRDYANAYLSLLTDLKKLIAEEELPKIEEKKEPIADEDEFLVKEWEEKIEDKKREEEEMVDELKREEAILKGRYNPPSLDL